MRLRQLTSLLHISSILLAVFLFMPVAAEEETFRLLDSRQGLRGRNVLQMTQLPDGRMAVVTESHVCFYDGKAFRSVARDSSRVYPLPGYKGYTHIYIDNAKRLWLKDWQRVACLYLPVMRWMECSDVSDLFVDSDSCLWTISSRGICREDGLTVKIGPEACVQDIDVADSIVYIFTDDGCVTLFNGRSGRRIGSYASYGSDEQGKLTGTSLVVNASDGCFYQLRTGAGHSVLQAFNRKKRKWLRLLDADYPMHTLIVTPDGHAYVSCERGYWVLNLKTGEQHLLTILHLPDGSTLSTGYNTICRDRNGGIWLGSYDKGLLYASPSVRIFDTGNGHGKRLLILSLLVVALVVEAVAVWLWWYRKNRQPAGTPEESPESLPPEQNGMSGQDRAFIGKATMLVEQNLSNTEYNVGQLASDLCMERTGLYKRLTALTGQTPVSFIRNIRLERAAGLLREGGHSIGEISRYTGFSSQGYFTKCFQKHFGCLPSDFT